VAALKHYLILGAVLVVLVVGVYLAVFRRADVARAAKGYKPAETPQVAADMFKKAIQAREYEYAADYCTAGFAEQLRRGGPAATEYATALDNLQFQLTERGLVRDEMKVVLYNLDPFPKDVTIVVGKESSDACDAVLTFAPPSLKGGGPDSNSGWKLNADMFQVYLQSMTFKTVTTATVPMKKEGAVWKFDVAVTPKLQTRVGYLNEKYKNYVNPFEIVTQEVKNDPATRENVTSRLRTLLEQAAKE
jgi:hypothetical protein